LTLQLLTHGGAEYVHRPGLVYVSFQINMTSTDASRKQYDDLWRDLWANTHIGGPIARTRYRIAVSWLGLGLDTQSRMLDVGAGNGAFIAVALRASPRLEIYGAEFSQAAIDAAPSQIRSKIQPCDLQGQQPLPWGGGFDVICCMEVLEHLPDDMQALSHIVGAMKPGGQLFISVPAWQSKWGPQDVTAGHVRRYEPDVLVERIERAGLEVSRIKCWGGPVSWAYLRAADLVGPERVMSVRPTGAAGIAAALIYHLLKTDDALSFGAGGQLFALAVRPDGR
jgi:2-polyprenyl-3-methyl-5-hydroxy-6-metoxy-1,4-benzoquinol methylase